MQTESQPADGPVSTPEQARWAQLTTREREVALELARGATNREVATQYVISIKTVDTHRAHLLKKLGVRNNVMLCRLAIRLGLVQP